MMMMMMMVMVMMMMMMMMMVMMIFTPGEKWFMMFYWSTSIQDEDNEIIPKLGLCSPGP